MNLAVFDLDHTLLATDSSGEWWQHMNRLGWVVDASQQHQHDQLMAQYDNGLLDMKEYLALTLAPLRGKAYSEVMVEAAGFVHQCLPAHLYPEGLALIEKHKASGDMVVIISASEHFIVEPWQALLGVDAALGVAVEVCDGRLTGQAVEPISYREGKVAVLKAWLADKGMSPGLCYAYSDSHNDIPLLEFAATPVAINPNRLLDLHAKKHDWPVLRFT